MTDMTRISKAFAVQYGGQFCVLCDSDLIEGDLACFVDEELAHKACCDDQYDRTDYKEPYTFDPQEWSK